MVISFVTNLRIHEYNKIKYFKILINIAFSIFNDGDFHCL